ncbi:MAG: iron dicitrate transporter FecR [Nitrospirales bacterium]|nr:MAG: iron dicitrate transporter FecR [Nitrospirales bacterium]
MKTPSRDTQPDPNPARLQQEAFDWLTRLTSGDTSPKDLKNFEIWKTRSQAHEQAWQEASRLWQGFEQLPKTHLPGATPLPATPRSGKRPHHRTPHRRRWTAALITASLLCALIVLTHSPHQWFADFSTDVGERRTVSLPDGSTVDMNSQTAFQLEFTATQRTITLLAGEAAFSVTPESARPFIVSSAQGTTRALGTEFIVRQRNAHSLVAVHEGTVDVHFPPHNQHAILKAGEAARYNPTHGLQPLPLADWEIISAWRDGYLLFQNTPLPDVITQMNLHRPGHMMLLNDALANYRISGLFRLDALPDVVTTIVETTPARLASVTPYLVLLY